MLREDVSPIIKEVKPINFLFYRTETNMSDLGKLVPVGQSLLREAVSRDLQITGPIHWHYIDFEGDASKAFTLEVALPVATFPKDYDGPFHFKRTEVYKSVSLVHDGSWLEIPASYDKIMHFMKAKNLKPKGVNREIYINADFEHPEANVTEIQLGIN